MIPIGGRSSILPPQNTSEGYSVRLCGMGKAMKEGQVSILTAPLKICCSASRTVRKAGVGNRTLVTGLESWRFTTKLHPLETDCFSAFFGGGLTRISAAVLLVDHINVSVRQEPTQSAISEIKPCGMPQRQIVATSKPRQRQHTFCGPCVAQV